MAWLGQVRSISASLAVGSLQSLGKVDSRRCLGRRSQTLITTQLSIQKPPFHCNAGRYQMSTACKSARLYNPTTMSDKNLPANAPDGRSGVPGPSANKRVKETIHVASAGRICSTSSRAGIKTSLARVFNFLCHPVPVALGIDGFYNCGVSPVFIFVLREKAIPVTGTNGT